MEGLRGFLFKAPVFVLGKKQDNFFHLFNIYSFDTGFIWLNFPCINMLNKKNLCICVSFKLLNYYDLCSGIIS